MAVTTATTVTTAKDGNDQDNDADARKMVMTVDENTRITDYLPTTAPW
jgi:hypothetical protein